MATRPPLSTNPPDVWGATLLDYVDDTATETVADHEAAADPHTGYVTDAGLASGLAGKSNTGHTHDLSDVEGFTLSDWDSSRGAPYYIGHRGAGDITPEHTIEAYETAVQYGLPVLEVSVVQTSDKVLVCNHDLTLDRMANTTGTIAQLPFTSLKSVTVTNTPQLGPVWTTGVTSARMALFEEVLRKFGKRQILICDAKDDAAYPAMVAMIEKYGLKNNVIIKAFYTSARLTQAKAAGYRTFGYFGVESDVTAPNLATLVAKNPDYIVIPTYAAVNHITLLGNSLVDMCVATGFPVWCYYTHRRYDRDQMAARGVVGFVIASPYVMKTTPMHPYPTWYSQAVSPGELVLDPSLTSYAPTWPLDGSNRIGLTRLGGKHFMMLGNLCPITATTYTITFEFRWIALPADTTQNFTVAFGRLDDRYYEHQLGIGTGYHAIMRANNSVQLFTHTDGSGTGTQIGTTGVTTAAPAVLNTWYTATVTVNPTTVTFTVNDGAPHTVTATDSSRRGGYIHIGKSSTDGQVEVRNLTIA